MLGWRFFYGEWDNGEWGMWVAYDISGKLYTTQELYGREEFHCVCRRLLGQIFHIYFMRP